MRIVGIILIIVSVVGGVLGYTLAKDFSTRAVPVQASILSVSERVTTEKKGSTYRKKTEYICSVEYFDSDKRKFSTTYTDKTRRVAGDTVTLYYDSSDPSVVKVDKDDSISVILVALVGVVIGFALIYSDWKTHSSGSKVVWR